MTESARHSSRLPVEGLLPSLRALAESYLDVPVPEVAPWRQPVDGRRLEDVEGGGPG